MPRRIIVILGHPSSHSLCHEIANTYTQAASEAGHQVKLFKLGEIDFDPILHEGYAKIQELEPSLVEIQQAITWAEHLVLVYPNWWGSMPALLKGFFDRAFLPGYAFKYRKDSQFWDKLLSGRDAQVFVTMDTPPWYYWLFYGRPGHHQIRKTILEFCGITPVKITSFGPVRYASAEKRQKWLDKVKKLARG